MKYFKRSEFKCKCGNCKFDTVDYELVKVLDELREHFNAPTTITSGCRCTSHNASIGGAKSSYHLYGKAADIKVSGSTPPMVYEYLDNKYPDKYGIGKYAGWVHIDVRTDKARW